MKSLRPLALEPLENRTLMSTCTVTRLSDRGAGVGIRGELRYCIRKANTEPGADLINFTVTGTINLNGPLAPVASDMHIAGPGADQLTVRRHTGGNYRVFTVLNIASVELSGLTISNGYLIANNYGAMGGGISNLGRLTLRNSHVTGNRLESQYGDGSGRGGGIHNSGSLLMVGSTVAQNVVDTETSYAYGGGIANHGDLTVIAGTIVDNDALTGDEHCHFLADTLGGGIYNAPQATASVYHTIISRNIVYNRCEGSGFSSGIDNDTGTLAMFSSTLYLNNVVTSKGWTLLSHSTIVYGNAIGVYVSIQASLYMRNTILAGGLYGALTSSGHNLISTSNQGQGYAPTDILDVNPLLGSLQDNGGLTLTVALLPGSPAIDAGDNADAPRFDQRGPGFPRIVNGTIDIGAFEVQATGIPGVSHPPIHLFITADPDRFRDRVGR